MTAVESTVAQPPPPALDKPALLIVDDEMGPRESLRIVFKDRYQCTTATCGREGIEHARTHHVDAAIIDIKMPDMTGIDVLKALKEFDPDVECVMLTGYETIETARAAVRYGAADYLNKPFDVFAVRQLLDQCMTRRRNKLTAAQQLRSLQRMNDDLARDLAESSRAVAASVLSAGVVHELNNPLAIIAGYTELVARDLAKLGSTDPGAAQNVQQRLAKIQTEIERCKGIARRFLNFARPTAAGAQAVEIKNLLDDAVALINAHPSNTRCRITATSEPGLKVILHPAEFLQVLLNLGINAVQAMNGVGALTFSAEPAIVPAGGGGFRSATFDPHCPLLKISIADTGCGISPENLQKIFDPYFTTKEQGTGLGLAIVCKLVDRCGGLLDVHSTVGHGTTFSLYLPLAL